MGKVARWRAALAIDASGVAAVAVADVAATSGMQSSRRRPAAAAAADGLRSRSRRAAWTRRQRNALEVIEPLRTSQQRTVAM